MVDSNTQPPKIKRIISALFLVAGTNIGGGMLALPVATGVSGFLPSTFMMILCWIAMTATALLLLEVSLWMEEGVHMVTMTSRLLGKPGRIIGWILYLFICYASLVAYTAGGGLQIATALNSYFNISLSKELACLLFIFVFGSVIYLGSRFVGRVNTVLFVAMIMAYVVLIGIGVPEIKPSLLLHKDWSNSLMAIPLLLTSFSFQTMVPSLTPYLHRNIKALRVAVMGGTFLTLVIYVLWQSLILGIVPLEGPHGLAMALQLGEPATQFVSEHVNGYSVYLVAEYFAFFALITSFLGIAFGLYDFLSDGLKIKKQGTGQFILGLLIILPVFIFATHFERVFIVALETTGGFGDSVLNGIFPVVMVWIGRYYLKLGQPGSYRFMGGRPALVGLFVFFLASFILSFIIQTGALAFLYKPYEVPVHHLMEIK